MKRVNDTEKEIKAKIRYYLKKIPNSKFISYTPYPYGESGTPDIIGCIEGKMILIEVKRKGGELTDLQKIRITEWEQAKANVFVVHSVEELKNFLMEVKDNDPSD